ncbi:hypothetical protein TWF696_004656 [Orbilia brochopaga]|uniref:Uncharacterized protein n=1 Tax=Orbilia brochopaga TaxID=3140254 RepID=A0AAV9VA28_9PEZI
MHFDKRLLLPLASIPAFSSAYFLSFQLRPAGLFAIPPSPSDEDSGEQIFDPSTLERPGTTVREPAAALDLSNSGLQEINLGRAETPATGGTGINIAGRISSLPSRPIYGPIADYSGNRLQSAGRVSSGRRLSTFLSDELDLSDNTNEQPLLRQLSNNNADGTYTAAASVPGNSGGRCIEFRIDREGLLLQSMTFSTFAEDDLKPVAIAIFSVSGCRSNTQIAYIDLDFSEDPAELTVDLSYLDQPVSNRFSALPVYLTVTGSQTELVGSQEIAQEFGRPRAPINILETSLEEPLNLDENLLPGDDDDYWANFDTPWDQLRDNNIDADSVDYRRFADDGVEEYKGTTPPRRTRPRPLQFYMNPIVRYQPGSSVLARSRSLGSSPNTRPFRFADSDDEQTAEQILNQNVQANAQQGFNPLDYAEFADDDDLAGVFEDFDESMYLDDAWWINRDPQSGGLNPWQRQNGPRGGDQGSRGL